jgi:hypothetical protein
VASYISVSQIAHFVSQNLYWQNASIEVRREVKTGGDARCGS